MTALDHIRDAWNNAGLIWQDGAGDTATAQAPGHSTADRSVSFRYDGEKILMNCHAGEETLDVLQEVGLDWSALKEYADYKYSDGRIKHRRPGKKIWQTGNTAGNALYRVEKLPEGKDTPVYLVDGEKDVHALEEAGEIAVTCGSLGSARKFDLTPLVGRDVIIVADKGDRNDVGIKHATQVAEALDGQARSVTVVTAKTGKDAADHIAAGHTITEFQKIDTKPTGRRAKITWASEIEPEPVRWAWTTQDVTEGVEGVNPESLDALTSSLTPSGRIPLGTLTVAAGREGTGKSSFGIWMTSGVTNGTLPGHFYGKATKTLYVAVEDSWKHTIVPRLMASGADLTKVGRFDVVEDDDTEVPMSLPVDNELLEQTIRDEGVSLVVLDPLMSVIGGKIDTHREREVRQALDPLALIADRTNCVVLCIAHFNKGSGTDVASLITGSGAFKNVPRSIFGFAKDETTDGDRVMTQVKNSLGQEGLPSLAYRIEGTEIATKFGPTVTGKFTFTGESPRTVGDILRANSGGGEAGDESGKNVAQRFVLNYVRTNANADGVVEASDVIKAGEEFGLNEDEVKNARRRCKAPIIGSRKGRGMEKGWVWYIADSEDEGAEGVKAESLTSSTPSVTSSPTGTVPTLPNDGDPEPNATHDTHATPDARREVLGALSATYGMDARLLAQSVSSRYREQVPAILDQFVSEGIATFDGTKYLLTTTQGAAA